MDGSQPRKTGFEKELVYAKVVIRGKAVEIYLKCVHMNDFGDTADYLKSAIDVIMDEYHRSIIEKTYIGMLRWCKYKHGQTQWGSYSIETFAPLASSNTLCQPQVRTRNQG